MPVLFGSQLFGPPELFGQRQNIGKLASIRPEPSAKLVFSAALMCYKVGNEFTITFDYKWKLYGHVCHSGLRVMASDS